LATALILGMTVPVVGALIIQNALPARSWLSLPIHSTLEVAGAALGLVLAALILFSRRAECTSRRMSIALALIAMAVLDIFHSCVPAGVSFVWLHSLAVLAGGVLFVLVWFPERAISRQTALAAAGAVLLVTTLVGALSGLYGHSVPAMLVDDAFTPTAHALNLLGGGLTILAALNFAVNYNRKRRQEDLLFLVLCLLFGAAGVVFPMSLPWDAGWWFRHVLRFGGYFLGFSLAIVYYRRSEDETLRAHSDLDALFRVAFDGKRLVDRQFNQLRTNDTFISLSGVGREAAEKMKCYDVFRMPLCDTDECPIRQFERGVTDSFEREATKTGIDGKEVTCILKAVRLNAPDGSFMGLIESFLDITERKQAEIEIREKSAQLQRLSSELETITDSIPGLVFYKDTENRYIRVNKYVADAQKMTKEQLEGKSLYDIYPREQAQAYLDDDLEVINSRKPKLNFDEPWKTEAGTRWLSTSKIPYVDEKGDVIGVIGVSMDVTERKEAEEAIARHTRVMEAINRVFRGSLTCKTEEEVAKAGLRVTEELTGSKFGFIAEINAAGLVDTIAITDPGWDACKIVVSEARNFIKNMPVRGIDRSTLKEGKSRIVNANEIRTHPDRVGEPEGHPQVTCFLGVPFMREGKAVGMIGLANKEGGYTQEDQNAVEALSVVFYEALVKKRMENAVERQNWIGAGRTKLNDRMRRDKDVASLTQDIVTCLAEHLKAEVGALFLAEDSRLVLKGRYAYRKHASVPEVFALGDGLVGQAALDKKPMLVTDLPDDYILVGSGLGKTSPNSILLLPFFFDGQLKGVIELGSLKDFSELQMEFLSRVGDGIAIAIQTAQAREQLKVLLKETQKQTEELRVQEEELRAANDELEEQTQRLQASEERLEAHQEQLRVTNEELEEKNEMLERQKRDVEQARSAVEEKAGELALASKYKSEFLTSMSHELRSPLNSLLLLAQGLGQNKQGNLTDDQVESAKVIHGSGSDLLNLINDILDLSKIEAGRMDLQLGTVRVGDLADGVRACFGHVAEEKGLKLEAAVRGDAPAEITSDRKRVEQVIRNLVSNALKFTEKGSVSVTFGRSSAERGALNAERKGTSSEFRVPSSTELLCISVADTGIGIAPGDQKMVFEAFRQANGGTARRHGGTGLGLSISRELANLLGGEIQLESEPGKGSTFSLYIPVNAELSNGERGTRSAEERREKEPSGIPSSEFRAPRFIPDDRESITDADHVILVVEDDSKFAKVLYDKCHERGFKCLAAPTAEAGLELAGKHLPHGILLDIRLPGMDGWAVLGLLKDDIRTRHIPVHVLSVEEATTESLRKGAVGHATKPINREELEKAFKRLEETAAQKTKRVLIVEDDDEIRRSVKQLIGNGDVKVDEAATGEKAIEMLRAKRYGCLILDLCLPDMDGGELLKRVEAEGIELPPVIVNTARDLTEQEEMDLRERAESIVIKDVRSQERLLDEVSLFLHRMVEKMPEKKKQMIRNLHEADILLKDRKVLVVDDDMRTTFALSRLLSERGMKPLKAGNGQQALQVLGQEQDVDLVLMDIMMPVMDGYEAIRRIRSSERGTQKLPVIALTAKAMPEDRQKCIEAGASDYLSKPVDQERLISMMRVWLYR
jgi:PAS domain S-box-containing protein